MKPYVGILIDSFWEAVGNKVLWAQLLGWTFILGALAPFGYVTERSFEITSIDIADVGRLTEKLAKGVQGRGPREIQHIASLLDPESAERIVQAARAQRDSELASRYRLRESEMAKVLTKVLHLPDLYSAEVFPTAARRDYLKPLIDKPAEQRSAAEVEELNRHLLQMAFPTELNRPRGEQLWIGYAGFKLGEPLPITRRQIEQFIQPLVLQFIIKFGLAIIAVFIAIIVTSPMIPETFRGGTLHLLLSKPISRVGLYLTKFFGGTVFVLVTITYVMLGLYGIAGWRFGIWNDGLLYCIPVLVFVFIVFYSVSALAGLKWGNAIVCVVVCGIFWFTCFVLGVIHDSMLPHVDLLPRIAKIEPIEGRLTVVNEKGEFNVWNEQFHIWQPAADTGRDGQSWTFGPIYLAGDRKILFKSFRRLPLGGLASRSRKLAVIDLQREEEMSQTPVETMAGRMRLLPAAAAAERSNSETQVSGTRPAHLAEDDAGEPQRPPTRDEIRQSPLWTIDLGPELPQQLFTLLQVGEDVIAVCRSGIYRMDRDLFKATESTQFGLFGIQLPWLQQTTFQNVSPEGYFPTENTSAAPLRDGSGLVVYSSGNLDVLKWRGDRLQVVASTKLSGDGTELAILAMNESFCVVARPDMPLVVLDAGLQVLHEVQTAKDFEVKQIACIPDSNDFSIVSHDGRLVRLQPDRGSLLPIPVGKSSFDVTCVRWLDQHHAYIGVRPDRVYKVDTQDGTVLESYVPVPRLIEKIFRWAVVPVYTVMPKPAALDNVMTWLLTDDKVIGFGFTSPEQAKMELEIWQPLIANTLFVLVMLAVGSWYVARKEF